MGIYSEYLDKALPFDELALAESGSGKKAQPVPQHVGIVTEELVRTGFPFGPCEHDAVLTGRFRRSEVL